MEEDFIGLLPAQIRYNRDLKPNEKVLYSELLIKSYPLEYCEINNMDLATAFHVTRQSVSGWLSDLVRAGYIEIKVKIADPKLGRVERKIYPLISSETRQALSKLYAEE